MSRDQKRYREHQKRRYAKWTQQARARATNPISFLPLENAPTFDLLVLTPPPRYQLPAEDYDFRPPALGLTPADIAIGKQAEYDRAEARAASMLKLCRWCTRQFLPERSCCTCCSRKCYLLDYRRQETETRRERFPFKVCIRCHKPFRAIRGRGETCSPGCCQAIYQRRRRAKQRAQITAQSSLTVLHAPATAVASGSPGDTVRLRPWRWKQC